MRKGQEMCAGYEMGKGVLWMWVSVMWKGQKVWAGYEMGKGVFVDMGKGEEGLRGV